MSDPTFLFFVSLILAASVFLLTLINTTGALVLLAISMLLSPELSLASMPGRSVVVRFDDLLIIVIFFTWLAKMAINKQLSVLRPTPLLIPMLVYIVSSVISTSLGVMTGGVGKPIAGLFYTLKYIEFLVLYFMVSNAITSKKQCEIFIKAILFTAFCVALYGFFQLSLSGHRVTAPFEGKAEPNTLAGYLIMMMCMCMGMGIHTLKKPSRLIYFGLTLFMLIPFTYTYSRGGYIGLICMFVCLCLMSKKYRLPLISFFILICIALPFIVPESVIARIASTFDPTSTVQVAGVKLSGSPAGRIVIWKYVIEEWMKSPIFGFGVTGIGFVDSQYATLLGEQGIFGLITFLWVRWRAGKVTWSTYQGTDDALYQGLCLGFMCTLICMMVLSFTGNIFIIVRIVEPFWFLMAMVTAIPHLEKEEQADTDDTPTLSRMLPQPIR